MAYDLNWSLLGQPNDVGGAVRAGFEAGATRSALTALANNPGDPGALSRLAAINPALAMQMRDTVRQEQFRTAARSAFDPVTGNINAPAMRRAYADSGDVAGAMEFDRNRATTQRTQQTADYDRIRRLADLLDDSTDQASYARNREIAISTFHADPAAIPEQFDPQWVASQRSLVGALGDRRQMTTQMQNYTAGGGRLDTPEGQQQFMRFLQQSQPMVAVDITQPDGSVVRQYMSRPTQGGDAAPGGLTTEELDALEQGGPAPAAGPATFP